MKESDERGLCMVVSRMLIFQCAAEIDQPRFTA